MTTVTVGVLAGAYLRGDRRNAFLTHRVELDEAGREKERHQVTNEIRRMWVNQPSRLQPHHDLHGTRVLAVRESENIERVYFLSGDIIDQQMVASALSAGWPDHLD